MITASSKLSKDDVDKYVKDAEQYANDDKKKKEEVEVRNESDNLVYTTEKSLKENGDKVSSDDRLQIEQAITDVKNALKANEVEQMKKAKEVLIQSAHKLAEAIYKEAQKAQEQKGNQQPPQGNAGQGPSEGASEENVVDAEVVDDEGKGK